MAIPSGHGIAIHSNARVTLFDLTRERIVTPPGSATWTGIAVRGLWVLHRIEKPREWKLFDPDRGTLEPCPELQGTELLSLLNDDVVLFKRNHGKGASTDLLAYRLADRYLETVTTPAELSVPGHSAWIESARSEPDAQGRIWLRALVTAVRSVGPWINQRHHYLAVDPTTRRCEILPVGNCTILAFADDRHVLVLEEERRIVRSDYVSGARTVLFPRADSTQ
jgi:hypothetical protein